MAKLLAPLRRQQDKAMISYFCWVHIDKSYKIVIGVDKHNINADNSTECADITILENGEYGFIATNINARDLTDCSDNAAGGMISDIDAVDSKIALMF